MNKIWFSLMLLLVVFCICSCGIKPSIEGDSTIKTKNDTTNEAGTTDKIVTVDPSKEFTIYYDAIVPTSGLESQIDSKTIRYGQEYGEFPELDSYEGYVFSGWYTELDGGDIVNEHDVFKGEYNKTLYARYERIVVTIDPFKGLNIIVTGISPYCQVSINNQDCSEEAQRFVNYTTDKNYYANGDEVLIFATLSEYTGAIEYELSEKETKYTVNNQPEYITSIDGLDISNIKTELDDFVASNIADAIKHGNEGWMYSDILGASVYSELRNVEGLKFEEMYFLCKKLQKYNDLNMYFNYLTFTYSGAYSGKFGSGNFYSCVSAVNIVKYPDGKLKWGTNTLDDCDFIAEGATNGMDYSISSYITVKRSDYNITTINKYED